MRRVGSDPARACASVLRDPDGCSSGAETRACDDDDDYWVGMYVSFEVSQLRTDRPIMDREADGTLRKTRRQCKGRVTSIVPLCPLLRSHEQKSEPHHVTMWSRPTESRRNSLGRENLSNAIMRPLVPERETHAYAKTP